MSGEMMPQPPPMEAPPVLEPKRLKVFGVIHIVFGCLGILGAVLTLVMALLLRPLLGVFFENLVEGEGANDENVKMFFGAMETMMTSITPSLWIKGVLGLVVGVLILISGIRLVKRRRGSVASSNLYAWASIACRGINLVAYLLIVMPANNRYFEQMEEMVKAAGAPPPTGGTGMVQMQQLFGVGGTVLGTVLALVYPILALVMLNKPVVKDFLAKHGT